MTYDGTLESAIAIVNALQPRGDILPAHFRIQYAKGEAPKLIHVDADGNRTVVNAGDRLTTHDAE